MMVGIAAKFAHKQSIKIRMYEQEREELRRRKDEWNRMLVLCKEGSVPPKFLE